MIKAIVFDFDGLIVDTESAWFDCYAEVLGGYDIPFPTEVFAACVGSHGGQIEAYIRQMAEGRTDISEVRKAAAKLHAVKMETVTLRDGVAEYIEAARRLGLKVGLASSSDRAWVESFLRRFGLLDSFEVIKTKDDVANVKPDPELYLKAIQALGIEAHEALAFEDSANGAAAAKAAGLWCVIVPNPVTEQLAFGNVDGRLRSMTDRPLEDVIGELQASPLP
ncbi:HAD family hydrolase [Paenibacillus tyrfis]|uniref:HAD family hydrolase n=1 Tax=Paenibacillus tyrfis TaxID=1501230 RepID=UPI00248FE20E|nr:HAD-IA family hydrolase [Paenibacillus tyrfis]